MLFADAVEEYLIALKGVRADATKKWYENMLKALGDLNDKHLAEITATDLRKCWAKLADRKSRWVTGMRPQVDGGLSPATLAGYYRAWRTYFQWCVDQDYIPKNVMRKLKRPLLPDQPPKAIAENDLTRMMQATNNKRDYAIVCVFAITGCRIGGMSGMTVQDVDLQTGRLWVTEKGPGGGKRRCVYLHTTALHALRDYLFIERRWGVCDGLFLLPGGEGDLTLDGIRSVLRRLAAAAGVELHWNAHAFRHRFARNAISNGADLSSVSQMMGHSDVSVTEKFYARWADEELRQKHRQFSTLPKLPEQNSIS